MSTEEERILQVMRQPMLSGTAGGVMPQARPGPNYICHRCWSKGHFIKNCPTNGDPAFDPVQRRSKRPSGIPTAFLQVVHTVNEQERESLLELPSGQLARRVEDKSEFEKTMKPHSIKVPDELRCKICMKPHRLAVMTRCCSMSFCYDCISPVLIPPDYKCPHCNTPQQLVHSLIPNHRLRQLTTAIQSNSFPPYTIKQK